MKLVILWDIHLYRNTECTMILFRHPISID
jgi:hypothetical protein